MPSFQSKVVLGALRRGKGFFSRVGGSLMQNVHFPDQMVADFSMDKIRGELFPLSPVPALMLLPPESAPPGYLIVHCHGGAYVSGGLTQARAIAALICGAAHISTVTFAYRLAPEHPYPAALEDALALWDAVLAAGYAPEHIVLAGESAGGNLCLALCQALQSEGRPLPAAMALLSPWADLLQTGPSYQALKDVDATLSAPELMQSALDYAGGQEALLHDPMLSPVYADFAGFPPTQIHVGTSELLLSDAETLAGRMRQAGVEVALLRWAGMCHVFQMFGFPESRESLKAVGQFLREQLKLALTNEKEG